jgi:glycosyltransferase involved in cell wall biosynthesis
MILLDHSTYDEHSISSNLGAPEYSYWFVRKRFRPILDRFGIVVPVANPEREVDRIYRSATAHRQPCAFLCFNPPQYVPVDLACPTIPVFAWEFDVIPSETWNANPREDWRYVLARTGVAVTHSSESVRAIRQAMGEAFPVWCIPAPVFDQEAVRAGGACGWCGGCEIPLGSALAIDAAAIDLSLFSSSRLGDGQRGLRQLRRAAADPARPQQCLQLEGVIYTAIFNPVDGRKNWIDMLAGFVWAFRNVTDATLILKLTHADMLEGVQQVLEHIAKLGQFRCRIVLIHGMLSDAGYGALIEATSFTVNTSDGEGQCLPLMEFMSAGRPAIAPRHTAMKDYITEQNAFVVSSRVRQSFWPHDERQAIRCLRHQISFADLVGCFRRSYEVGANDPQRYALMSIAAVESLRQYCSEEIVMTRLTEVFAQIGAVADDPGGAATMASTAAAAKVYG